MMQNARKDFNLEFPEVCLTCIQALQMFRSMRDLRVRPLEIYL